MSLDLTLSRIADLRRMLDPPVIDQGATALQSPTASVRAPVGTPATFATALEQAQSPNAPGNRIVTAAQREVGQQEAPAGSNDSPRIAQYRASVPGGPVGPWCAYFASWASSQAGAPLGDRGQGFARVDDVWAWGQRTGRAVTGRPQPGDLIIWDEHMGIVESVAPDGSIRTIEGNSSDAVSSRTYGPDGGGSIGFVRPGPAAGAPQRTASSYA